MSSSGAIRAGRAFIELGLDDKTAAGLKRAGERFRAFGRTAAIGGAKMAAAGAALGAPLALATAGFAKFEQELANLRAAANPTAGQMEAIRSSIDSISKTSGQSSAEIASAFTELLKAGMSVETVLGGAGEAAVKFARVGGLDMANAATVMTDALNVFAKQGLTAEQAVDAMSKAADASSIGIEQIAQSFSMSSAVFGSAGLEITDLTTAIGLLGSSGVKGSDAGTSLKTMLLRLQTGAESAGVMMKQLGINVRDGAGQMKPMRGIVAELQAKLGGLNAEARDQAMLKLFGSDAIRAGSILFARGVDGWDQFQGKMEGSLTVAQKFDVVMDTLYGAVSRIRSGFERLQIVIGEALAGPLGIVGKAISALMEKVTGFAANNRTLVIAIAGVAAGLVAGGAALVAVGIAASLIAPIFSIAASAILALSTPLGWVLVGVGLLTAALAALGGYLLYSTEIGGRALHWLGERFDVLKSDALVALDGIKRALAAGDYKLAAQILWASVQVVWTRGKNAALGVFYSFSTGVLRVWNDLTTGVLAMGEILWSGIRSATIEITSFLLNAWAKTSAAMKTLWNETSSYGSDVANIFGEKLGIISKEDRNSNIVSDHKDYWAKRKEIEDKAHREIAAIEALANADREAERKRHLDRMAGIAGSNQQDNNALRQAREREAADALRNLEELIRQRNALVAGAPANAAKAPAEAIKVGTAKPLAVPDFGGAMDVAEQVASSRGTFSAFALQSLQGGTAQERTAKATESTAKQVGAIRQRIDNWRGAGFA